MGDKEKADRYSIQPEEAVSVMLERLQVLRQYHRFSQADLSEQLGIKQTTYSDYEGGKVRIPVDKVIALAALYDVDMNYICGVTERSKPFPRKYWT